MENTRGRPNPLHSLPALLPVWRGQPGFCYIRKNINAKLYSLGYGKSTGFAIDPIEKKPLNHFLPGTGILSFGTAGCNPGCRFCQNWSISKAQLDAAGSVSAGLEDVVALALQCDWILKNLGDSVPLHFTAFHPGFKMMDRPKTPASTLKRARRIALSQGIRYCYLGNVSDNEGQITYCPSCGTALIRRSWHDILEYRLSRNSCPWGAKIPGYFPADTTKSASLKRRGLFA